MKRSNGIRSISANPRFETCTIIWKMTRQSHPERSEGFHTASSSYISTSSNKNHFLMAMDKGHIPPPRSCPLRGHPLRFRPRSPLLRRGSVPARPPYGWRRHDPNPSRHFTVKFSSLCADYSHVKFIEWAVKVSQRNPLPNDSPFTVILRNEAE